MHLNFRYFRIKICVQFSSLLITYYVFANPIVLSLITLFTAARKKNTNPLIALLSPAACHSFIISRDNFPNVKNVDTLIFCILSAITASSFRKYPSPAFCRFQVLLCCPFSNRSGVSVVSDVQHSISCVKHNSALGNTVTSPQEQRGMIPVQSVYCKQSITGASSRKPRFTPLFEIYCG